MREVLIFIFLLMLPLLNVAQTRSYDISLSYGSCAAPSDFPESNSKDYWFGDFSFLLSDRWSLTSGFLAGKFNYYDSLRSNSWDEITKYTTVNTNARGYNLHTFVLFNYNLLNLKNLYYIQTGVGGGFFTQRLKYPYRQPCSSGCVVFIGEESSSGIEFPISFKAYYLFKKRVGIGIIAGGFINTKLKITGMHIGPQIRVRL